MRLFFALWPDAGVRRALVSVAASLVPPEANATRAQNLHLTLAFLGAVPADQLPEVLGVAGRLRGSPIVLTLDRVERWAVPGVLCLTPGVVPPALSALATDLRMALRAAGLPADERPYRPHVTLCRKAHALPPQLAAPATCIDWRAEEFVLVESADDTGRSGYRIVARWRLQAIP